MKASLDEHARAPFVHERRGTMGGVDGIAGLDDLEGVARVAVMGRQPLDLGARSDEQRLDQSRVARFARAFERTRAARIYDSGGNPALRASPFDERRGFMVL